MTSKSRTEGFTLIELMVTVAILMVLTAVAVVSYKYFIRRARIQEGVELLQDIRMKQESYFSTYSQYVDTSTTEAEGGWFPKKHSKMGSGADDPTMWDWGQLNSDCGKATPDAVVLGWCHLGMKRNSPTYFRAVSFGWNKAKGTTAPSSGYELVKGMDFSQRWFYVVAHADMDQDGTFSTFLLTSQHNDIVKINETE